MQFPASGAYREGRHRIAYRVYYEDTDAGGVMYYANYLRFAERARTEALRCCGIEQRDVTDRHGIYFVVRRCEVDYLAPARLDDVLVIETALQRNTKVRMSMQQRLGRAERDVARVAVDIVCVNTDMRPVPMPDEIERLLLSHLTILDKGESVE